jgi:hypothetical protein
MSAVKMELEPHPNKRFMPIFDRYEPLLKDHSSILVAKECLRKYFYKVVLQMKVRETEPYFAFGSAYHKFREVLERKFISMREEGASLEDATLLSFQPALVAACALYDKEMPRITETKWEFMTKDRLILSCKAAWAHWIQEKKIGKIKVLAVEQFLVFQLPDGSYRSGRCDQLVEWNGAVWGRDWKTTSTEQKWYGRGLDPNHQFTLYTYGEQKISGKPVRGQLIEVLHNSKTKGPAIWPFTAERTPEQLREWERDSIHWNSIITQCRESDNWPKSEVNCGRCEYHSVCAKTTETGQQAHLKNNYALKIWDPSFADVD